MKHLLTISGGIIFFNFVFLSGLHAGEVTYFAADGSVISRQQYEILQKEHAKKINEKKKKKLEALLKITDEKGRPVYDSEGRKINYVELQPGYHKLSNAGIKKNTGDIPRDMFGRPLKTPEGFWITYPDDSNYFKTYSITIGSSPSGTTPGTTGMSAAQEADYYRERYIKSSKTTDLVKFKNAFRRAID